MHTGFKRIEPGKNEGSLYDSFNEGDHGLWVILRIDFLKFMK